MFVWFKGATQDHVGDQEGKDGVGNGNICGVKDDGDNDDDDDDDDDSDNDDDDVMTLQLRHDNDDDYANRRQYH